ncbi:histone-like nucleoid-structuring protein, MvaT/MvaU family [Stutzerimonas stutzeri]|uniref:histone-like nucleoid-structuring protein, MvaT/MvaU family n=1 Tax=Stutzerimonas stutzeri TaxID=316 RepID=UPI002108834D|nr:histone-like nucleoid-structuring protein, MvaT/MvaU family [Stutzerimonas stutzeri]MCQ4258163.1 DNA binding protein [Stutzerimonas stutzeri]
MSKIAEYKRLEAQLAEQLAALDKLKGDNKLQQEMEFEARLRGLLEEYGFNLETALDILNPDVGAKPMPPFGRRARVMKKYTNPHTGEIVETKGGNHKIISAWKAQYGAKEVQGWVK